MFILLVHLNIKVKAQQFCCFESSNCMTNNLLVGTGYDHENSYITPMEVQINIGE